MTLQLGVANDFNILEFADRRQISTVCKQERELRTAGMLYDKLLNYITYTPKQKLIEMIIYHNYHLP